MAAAIFVIGLGIALAIGLLDVFALRHPPGRMHRRHREATLMLPPLAAARGPTECVTGRWQAIGQCERRSAW